MMFSVKKISLFVGLSLIFTGCMSKQENNVLESAVSSSNAKPAIKANAFATTKNNSYAQATGLNNLGEQSFDDPFNQIKPESKTYLINGLASSVKSIGYGFTNLSKKIPNSSLYNYASFVESSTIIRSRVTKDIKAQYKRNPNIEINLIGISFGANIVTLIAADLNRAKVPVNYLVTMEGPAMVPIHGNVKMADNFSCTGLNCFRTKPHLSLQNKNTRFSTYKVKTSHIPLANHKDVHSRILAQLK